MPGPGWLRGSGRLGFHTREITRYRAARLSRYTTSDNRSMPSVRCSTTAASRFVASLAPVRSAGDE
jgi:hypothetical protein